MTSSPARDSSQPDRALIDAQVDLRACENLLGNGQISVVAGLVIAVLLAVAMSDSAPPGVLPRWLGLLGAISLVRVMLNRSWRLKLSPGLDAPTFLFRFRFLVLLSGVCWGASFLMLQPLGDAAHQLIVLFCSPGESAGAMTTLAIDAWTVRLFLLPCMLPMAVQLMLYPDRATRMMGLMCLLFIGFMALNSSRIGRNLRTNLRLEIEAEQRERVLRDSEYRLNAAQKVAQIGSFDWDLVTGALRWSDEHFRLWGLDPGSSTPSIRSFSERVHPEDRLAVKTTVADAVRLGRSYDLVHRVRWPDGTELHVRERGDVEKDEAGKVIRVIGTVQDVTATRAAEARNHALAYYDPLTGLPNRHLLQERLAAVTETNALTLGRGALLLIDLDHFRNLNDSYGHDQGDAVLRLVAERIQACVRRGDTVARLGGDEFLVLLDNLPEDPEQAAAIASAYGEKIQSALRQPYPLAEREYHLSSSLGIKLFQDAAGGLDEIFKRAELALYEAKDAGRNGLRFYTPEMQARAIARVALEADLREAVERNQLQLHYQGQVDAAGRWIGAEALLRWQHPARGFVPPDAMIPIAEESGLIVPIGQWVLDTACAQLVEWSRIGGLAHLTLAVNVSARQFRQPGFVEDVLASLRRSGADPRKLKLELTESLLLHDVEGVIGKMATLRSHGIGFALDDFGTGYSSLSYLKRLPLSQLKIDKIFVRDVLEDANVAGIVTAILGLGRILGLEVVAEGVETPGQRAFLAENGCNGFQGYLFCRPMPAALFRQRVGEPAPVRAALA